MDKPAEAHAGQHAASSVNSWRHRVAGHFLYGAIVAFVGFIAVLLGTLYSDEIKGTFSAHWFNVWKAAQYGSSVFHNHAVAHTCFFWAIAFFWLFLFTVQETTKSESIADLQSRSSKLGEQVLTMEQNLSAIEDASDNIQVAVQRLETETLRITEAVNTMPPRDFVRHFCRASTVIHTTITKNLPRHNTEGSTKSALERTIRFLVSDIASLANLYDGRDSRYAANVMVFISRADKEPYFPGFTNDLIERFLPEGYGQQNLSGVLHLVKGLSAVASLDLSRFEQDDSIEEIIFGIPHKALHADCAPPWKILPGGPFTYAKWERLRLMGRTDLELPQVMHGVDDMTLYKDFLTGGRMPRGEVFQLEESLIERIERYYGSTVPGQNVRSFQSLPLVANTGKAVGVLNVHCNKPIFLGQHSPIDAERRREIFAGIVTPILFEISNLVSLWHSAKDEQYAIR